MMKKSALALPLLAALAACSDDSKVNSFTDALVSTQQLLEEYKADETATATLPTKGEATYQGHAIFGDFKTMKNSDTDVEPSALAQATNVVSDAKLTVNFKDNDVTGGFENFRDADNNAIDGDIKLKGGKLGEGEFRTDIKADLDGTYKMEKVTGTLIGGFYGKGAQAVFGGLEVQNVGKTENVLDGVFAVTQPDALTPNNAPEAADATTTK